MEIVNWPFAIIILGIVFMFFFRKQIGDFLSRATKAGPSGIEAAPQSQVSITSQSSQVEDLMRSFDSPVLKGYEEAINKD